MTNDSLCIFDAFPDSIKYPVAICLGSLFLVAAIADAMKIISRHYSQEKETTPIQVGPEDPTRDLVDETPETVIELLEALGESNIVAANPSNRKLISNNQSFTESLYS